MYASHRTLAYELAMVDLLQWIKRVRRPGVEPGSTAWKATMLTVTPPMPAKL